MIMQLPLDTCSTLEGRIGAIICWYSDEWVWDYGKWSEVARLVNQAKKIAKGQFEDMSDWEVYIAMDSIGTFTSRDQELEAVFQKLLEENRKRGKSV